MAKRSVLGSVGFYSELAVGDEKEDEVCCLEVGEGRKECLLWSGWWRGGEERYQNITSCYVDNNYYNKMIIAYMSCYIL